MVAALLMVVGMLLAPYLRAYVDQRGEIAALQAEVVDRERRVGELEEQRRRWDDPAYVTQQARERFGYVLPGEVGYVVLDPPEEIRAAEDPAAAAAAVADREGAWYGNLWESVVVAGNGSTETVLGSAPAADSLP